MLYGPGRTVARSKTQRVAMKNDGTLVAELLQKEESSREV